MVSHREDGKAKAAPRYYNRAPLPEAPVGRSSEDYECRHCDAGHVPDAIRGSSGTHRWVNCRPCNRRMFTQRRRHAAQGWAWMVINAVYTQFGNSVRRWLMQRATVESTEERQKKFEPSSRVRPTAVPKASTSQPSSSAATDVPMPDPGAVATPARPPVHLRPETLVGSGPYAAWRHHEMFESTLDDVMAFCCNSLEDPDTQNEKHEL